ncbi:hypothetical protein QBC38DRAFT_131840 [Podospora fimiseda]|uniref:Rhodopsin domain-containing protein n=1 Tax=Podospora fimiseda TaxID=252190 RepID=A0AAN7BTU7_9PEZI|nr:hypothetical protein QBC38DRAFT_131840 [Podospora fimiseda]
MSSPNNNSSRKGPILLSLSLTTATFALSTTIVRFYTRANIIPNKSLRLKFLPADYTSLIATIIAFISTIFGIIEATSTTSNLIRALEYSILGQPWYLMSVTLSKISICLFFMRFLKSKRRQRSKSKNKRRGRWLLGSLIVFMAIVNLGYSLSINLQCRPLEKLWNDLGVEEEGGCWDLNVQRDFGYFQGAFSVFTWFFLAFFPALIAQYFFSRDHRKPTTSTSWPFYVSFGLSFTCGILAIVKTAQTSQTSGVRVYTVNHFYVSLMANLEQNLGLVSANVLALGPLFSSFTISSSSSSGSLSTQRSTSKRSLQPTAVPLNRSGSSRTTHSHHTEIATDSKRSSIQPIHSQRASFASFVSFGSELILDDDEDIDLEEGGGWPKGIIIKTVSVEVVTERVNQQGGVQQEGESSSSSAGGGLKRSSTVITVPPPAARKGKEKRRMSNVSFAGNIADWEVMLRAGPSSP